MKSISSLFFILLYIVALLRPVAPLVDYAINQKLITEEFCENKSLPELECNGKCYLSKQLKKANKQKENDPIQLIINWNDYPIGFISTVEINLLKVTNENVNQDCIKNIGLTSSFVNTVFPPPKNS